MNSVNIPNLLLVAGDGRNSGKTTLCCRIISEAALPGLVAVKISQHFHPPSGGLRELLTRPGYSVYEEKNYKGRKDSSKMLSCGASRVFYLQADDSGIREAFSELLELIPENIPIVCESPSLVRHFEPGLFIIMQSEGHVPGKDITWMQEHPHRAYTLRQLGETARVPVRWNGISWEWD